MRLVFLKCDIVFSCPSLKKYSLNREFFYLILKPTSINPFQEKPAVLGHVPLRETQMYNKKLCDRFTGIKKKSKQSCIYENSKKQCFGFWIINKTSYI